MTNLESIVDDLARKVMSAPSNPRDKPLNDNEKLGLLLEDWQKLQEVVKASRALLDARAKFMSYDSDGLDEEAQALDRTITLLDTHRLERRLG
jgi:hypothetical protein